MRLVCLECLSHMPEKPRDAETVARGPCTFCKDSRKRRRDGGYHARERLVFMYRNTRQVDYGGGFV